MLVYAVWTGKISRGHCPHSQGRLVPAMRRVVQYYSNVFPTNLKEKKSAWKIQQKHIVNTTTYVRTYLSISFRNTETLIMLISIVPYFTSKNYRL